MNFIAPAFPYLEIFLSLGKSSSNPQTKNFQQKIHDYRQYEAGIDYVFEAVEEDNEIKFYMSGEGAGVKLGDYFIFSDAAESSYQVEQIEYYSNPPDRWVVLLKLVNPKAEEI